MVLHSVTKYLNGHSDMVGGALVTSDDALHEQLRFLQNAAGAVPGPMDCLLALRGTKTLAVRMQRHDENARALAALLAEQPKVVEGLLSRAAGRTRSTRSRSDRRAASAA